MQFHIKLSNYRKMAMVSQSFYEIKSFVFMDTETTGLPFYENNTTKITELCLTAVNASQIRLGVFPRVQNKLNLCFNPGKLISADSEKITGLSNSLLEDSSRFSKDIVDLINNFINHNPQPVCLVAHNGFRFDFPLFKREIDKTNMALNENILCIDTLIAFRELLADNDDDDVAIVNEDTVDNVNKNVPLYNPILFSCEAQQRNETTPIKQIIRNEHNYPMPKKIKSEASRKKLNFGPGFKLGDVFSRLTKKEPINSHQADGDVQMLIMCAATLGDKFVDWSNKNARKFCDISAMVPGRKIGT